MLLLDGLLPLRIHSTASDLVVAASPAPLRSLSRILCQTEAWGLSSTDTAQTDISRHTSLTTEARVSIHRFSPLLSEATMGLFNRSHQKSPSSEGTQVEKALTPDHPDATATNPAGDHSFLPQRNHNGHLITKGIHPDGESGRAGFHPYHFAKVLFRSSSNVSMLVNILWPFVPAAIALHFSGGDHHTATFAVNYIAMVPCANLLGFAGQELARKLPKVAGILIETTLGSVVEIVLFTVLIVRSTDSGSSEDEHNLVPVIQAAILGSIITNLLLCLGGKYNNTLNGVISLPRPLLDCLVMGFHKHTS